MRTQTPLLMIACLALSGPAWAQESGPGAAPAKGDKSPSAGASAVEDHQAQLLRFRNRIDDLRRRIEQAEKRTSVLKSSVLSGNVAQTRAVILHLNLLGGEFAMDSAVYSLDGKVIYTGDNQDGVLDEDEPLELFSGPIRAGEHELKVALKMRGRAYGPFTYLEGYKFNIQSKYVFQVVEGRDNRLEVMATQKDDITLEPQDRLTVKYEATAIDAAAAKSKSAQ